MSDESTLPAFDLSFLERIASFEPDPEEMAAVARERYALVEPFMIHSWPESVRAVSIETTLVEVDTQEMYDLFDSQRPDWKARATTLASRLDDVLDWERRFVRLSSRSPKDVVDLPITPSGRQAVDWITASERCMDDTSTAHLADKPTFVCLRKPLSMFADGEFRCFAKGGEVLGASRYFHRTAPEHRPEAGTILAAAKAFYARHLADHYPDVVFDLYLPGLPGETLIEVNPYGLSDPCLFGDYDAVERGGELLG